MSTGRPGHCGGGPRAFLNKLADSLGAEPDAAYLEMDASLRRTLTLGRRIDRRALERLR